MNTEEREIMVFRLREEVRQNENNIETFEKEIEHNVSLIEQLEDENIELEFKIRELESEDTYHRINSERM